MSLRSSVLGVILIWALTFLNPPLAARAQVKPQIEYETYMAPAQEGLSLSETLFAATPITENGRPYLGYTKYYLSYEFKSDPRPDNACLLNDLEIKCQCLITLPELKGGSKELAKEFQEKLAILKEHELEHCSIAARYAELALERLTSLSAPECSLLGAVVKQEFDQVLAACRKAQTDYDLRTDYGKKEAVFK